MSISAKHGILASQIKELSAYDFLYFLAGLDGMSPLGRVVANRQLSTAEAIKTLSEAEMIDRIEWQEFLNNLPD